MDDVSFGRLTLLLNRLISRRATVVVLGALSLPGLADARKRRRKRNKRKKKLTFNAFGCVDVGKYCKSSGQCCSGICEGKKARRKCQAHDTGGCPADQFLCVEGAEVACPDLPGAWCFRTTGNASFCGFGGRAACVACTQDPDCETDFGPGAACVVCSECQAITGTLCVAATIA